jgi:hypothetical protein
MFKLGHEVVIEGKLVKKEAFPHVVELMKARIKETGKPEVTSKYEYVKFSEPKYGVVVGIRSVASSRVHYLNPVYDFEFVETKVERMPAVLVACNLRGLHLVPIEKVYDFYDYELESEIEDFELA